MSRISVRGFAVASATAVTTVGAVVGVASGSTPAVDDNNFEATAADTTLLADIPAGQQAQVQTASLTQQADAQASAADAAAKKSAEEAARIQAAKDAKSKKQAAEDKLEQERQAKKDAERASRSEVRSASAFATQSSYTVAEVQAMARQMIPSDQFQCFSNIVNHESSWNYRATNASSGAYGLVQALPGSKMASAGADWQTNPATQIKWGLNYMDSRYGSPCGAWSFWQANNWY
ncbi:MULTISPECIES: transglycosylase SLT domain-containing protein [unclassified Streptomyces]|uniref:aggregation-promoting factor C-terminal-like domain-containing protein n=1 Tax=unclassified Streptomyces TaxID=2593676 RepID=UPI002DD8F3DF|nr:MULTISPECIES: transglycosylase SLT domain-containing protein [unclassified Streptomyces]WSF84762.1 transglycosylase SLT domain-containing protein [Streptomyces sp. NBC_01744]WSC38947.1 transglycosylase SLT domain-containing protein [Streptomyces sp. NBC_01763]WSC47090.1 transglycosylase SLT domain-containing protein [Streptomyces sp. NBC_01762]WSC53924.1 transglycosylase SLT domain-containing protein [Streptomyces sp. NBC_01761]WSD26744.1 transglycosylase SLT domain-containing protein [Stre